MARHDRPTLMHRLEALSWYVAAATHRHLPAPVLRMVAKAQAFAAFDLLRFRRDITLSNLATAFPELSEKERRRIGRASFEHALYGAMEFVTLNKMDPAEFGKLRVDVVNEEYATDLADKGAFVITLGHLGSWEFLPKYWSSRGFRFSILYKPMHNPIMETHFQQLRASEHVRYISTRLDPRSMWKELVNAANEKRAIVFLADQDARRDGAFVPFFGRDASTATGPATLALRMNLPILPVSCIRVGQRHFKLELAEPIYPPAGGRTPENIRWLTEQHVAALECAVRAAPEQYMWFHQRWKSKPRRRRIARTG